MDHLYRKLALMGGAYGNLPALEACLKDARDQHCDGCCFLGDAIGFAGHSDEILEAIWSHFDVFICGNLESEAVAGSLNCGCGYADPQDERTGCQALDWALRSLSASNRDRLAKLSDSAIVSTPLGRVLLCHGSPERQNEFLYDSQLSQQRLQTWIDKHSVQGIVCTHSGLPWMRSWGPGYFAMNCGATGKPDHDGDPAVHYGILEAAEHFELAIRSVCYDAAAFSAQLQAEGVDDLFIRPLRSGIWTCGISSLPEAELRECSILQSLRTQKVI